jgi:phage terminase large subunit-like protein
MGKRRQPLAVTITTAGDEKSEIWKEQHGACEKVLGGVYADDALFAFIAEIDPEDDPCDPACWPKANPNLGICVKPDYLIRLAEKARFDPAAKHILTRYHCNRMVLSSSKPITPEIWSRGAGPLPDLDRRLCHGGLDLGWRDDLAAFYLAFPITENGVTRYAFRGRCWIPSETPRELSREPWATWIRQGWLTVTDGNTTDPESILKFILECKQRYDLKTIALDPNNARSVATELVNARGLIVYEFYQTCRKYNEPTREFLRLLTEGLIQHGDDPLLSWAASNLILRHDASDYVMPAKHKSDDKIDPIVASLMAFSECLFAESASSVYEHRGVRVLE